MDEGIIKATLDNYTVTMWAEEIAKLSTWDHRRHLPTFLMPAYSPREAIIKIRAMYPESIRIGGKVMRTEPHCDREMDF
jgi:hypothetical protein